MIQVNDLYFSYGKKPFIENLQFEVSEGEIFGFLGPSGAGKSTLQKILIGMLPAYRGSVTVMGTEVRTADHRYYERIGIDFEFPSLYEKLTAMENLRFFASLYQNVDTDLMRLLENVGLHNDADKKVSDYSKGMKSRLNFVKALIHKPGLLFLDEPTSGLDPSNSRMMKDMILEQKREGTTIILTTHNMQDAQELCDRVAFIVDGSVKALDTPHNLIMQRGAGTLEYTYLKDGAECTGECALRQTGEDGILMSLIQGGDLLTVHSKEPNLGDIFMEVTGRKLA